MRWLLALFRRRRDRPVVRPWALATPVLVLLICLPLLRPLRHPGQASVDEELRLATISAIVEHQATLDATLWARLAIDTQRFQPRQHTIAVAGQVYSDQPPVLAFLLSFPYRVLYWLGYTLRTNSVFVPYLLTLLGATIPAAAAGGLIYRMARVFELRRSLRACLAAAVVFATGLISYAVVLNPHVPAAFLVLAAAGCLTHLAASANPQRGGAWIALAGFCAALAATIDLSAAIFLFLFLLAVPTMRLSPALRVGGVILYLLGAAPPILLHAALTVPLTGNLLPGSFHPELQVHHSRLYPDEMAAASSTADFDSEDTDPMLDPVIPQPPTLSQQFIHGVDHVWIALMGSHGLLVHFPVLIFGFLGIFSVMHRNWPLILKWLAAISVTAMILAIIIYAQNRSAAISANFANQWLIPFAPILLLWSGPWLRRKHHPATWTAFGLCMAFSVTVSLIGTTNPMPRGGYHKYTPVAALHDLFYPPSPNSAEELADR